MNLIRQYNICISYPNYVLPFRFLCRELFCLIFTTASVINVSVRSLVRVRAKTGWLGIRYVYQRTVVSVSYQSKDPIKCVGLVQSRHHHYPHLIEMYLVLGSVIFSCSTSDIHRVKCKNKSGNNLYSVISQNWGIKIKEKTINTTLSEKFPKSNDRIIERDKIYITNIKIHYSSIFWLRHVYAINAIYHQITMSKDEISVKYHAYPLSELSLTTLRSEMSYISILKITMSTIFHNF